MATGLKVSIRLARAALVVSLALAGCATRSNVFSDYYARLREVPQAKGARRTVVFFLVDGLALNVYQAEQTRLPQIRSFFESREGGHAYVGRASFPTLTYPNISSILTASPIGRHSVTGNLVYDGEKVVNYEKFWNSGKLNETLGKSTVFTAIDQRGGNSVSLSYYFKQGSTAHLGEDFKTGLAYLRENFRYVDTKTLGALDGLLTRTSPEKWPEFVFVHLIGFDALAHEHGPNSKEAREYLRELDSGMKDALTTLSEAEAAGKDVVTFLSADHGFMSVKRFSDVEAFVHQADTGITVLNQHRLASLYFPKGWTARGQAMLLAAARRSSGVSLTAQRLKDGQIWLETGGESAVLNSRASSGCGDFGFEVSVEVNRRAGRAIVPRISPFACPGKFETSERGMRPDLLASLVRYFWAKHRPDALLLAADGASFTRGTLGEHGGASEEESAVPLLIRNGRMQQATGPIPTYRLLSFLKASARSPGPAAGVPGEGSYSAVEETAVSPPSDSPIAESDSSRVAPVQFGLRLSTPTRVSTLSFWKADEPSGDSTTLRSPFSPGLSAEFTQYWSAIAASFVDYRISFANYGSGNSGAAQEFRVGAGYRFGDRDVLYGAFGLSEEYFSAANDLGSIKKLERLTIPEIAFGTRSRIYSFGLGDLAAAGRFSILLPKSDQGVEASVGFKEFAGLSFEHPIATTDLAGGELGYEHFSQDSGVLARSGWALVLGAFYGLSFQ